MFRKEPGHEMGLSNRDNIDMFRLFWVFGIGSYCESAQGKT